MWVHWCLYTQENVYQTLACFSISDSSSLHRAHGCFSTGPGDQCCYEFCNVNSSVTWYFKSSLTRQLEWKPNRNRTIYFIKVKANNYVWLWFMVTIYFLLSDGRDMKDLFLFTGFQPLDVATGSFSPPKGNLTWFTQVPKQLSRRSSD